MNKKIVDVRGMKLGTGLPKICIPLTAATKEELQAALDSLQDAVFDLVEWRADHYQNFTDETVCLEALTMIRKALGEKPLLFTIRTDTEGGAAKIDYDTYEKVNLAAARSGMVDLVDVELFTAGENAQHLVSGLHMCGAMIVGSSHDFHATPSNEEIKNRLIRMQELDMDIAKLAVMPQTKADVLRLMAVTEEVSTNYADRPVITMSMGKLGAVSRVSGSLTGSALTFGTKGNASAPGQIPATDLERILALLQID